MYHAILVIDFLKRRILLIYTCKRMRVCGCVFVSMLVSSGVSAGVESGDVRMLQTCTYN